MNGYIKLYRKMLDNPIICKDSDHLSIWVYLLLNATHDSIDMLFQGKRITLKAGQLITGRKSISSELNISESKVQRVIKLFESEQQIEQQISNKNRLITILNWSSYQSSEQQNEQQVNNNRTTSEQQVNTNKNDKNVKNDKNKKNIGVFDKFAEDNQALLKALNDYSVMRSKIKKPLTDRAKELLVDKLIKMQTDGEDIVECINNSTFNSWLGVFPIKTKEPKRSGKVEKITEYAPIETDISEDEIAELSKRFAELGGI